MKINQRLFCFFALTASLLFTACDSETETSEKVKRGGKTASALKGNIKVEGSSTVEPITNKAKELFGEKYPDIDISVGGQGTGNGFKSFAKKETDISDASRPIKDKELAACNEAGVEFIEIPVAYDGLTIVLHPTNEFARELTIDQLKKIFRSDNPAKNWKDVDESWPDEKIMVFAPGTGSGTYDYFVEVVCTEKVDGESKEVPLRSDDQISLHEDDKLIVNGVAGDEHAIGFFGYSYYENASDKLAAASVVNPKTGKAVAPSIATIESGEYAPLSRPLFIYVNVKSLEKTEVAKFIDFYLDNGKEIAQEAASVGLPAEVYERARQHVEKKLTGTHYLDAEGNKREGSLTEVYEEGNILKAN